MLLAVGQALRPNRRKFQNPLNLNSLHKGDFLGETSKSSADRWSKSQSHIDGRSRDTKTVSELTNIQSHGLRLVKDARSDGENKSLKFSWIWVENPYSCF